MSENVNNSKGKENNVDQLFSSRSMTQIICFVIVATAAVFGTAPAFCFSCFMIDFCSLMVYDIYRENVFFYNQEVFLCRIISRS